MEKSFAVDAAGVRRVLKAGQEAAKNNLKIAGGLMCRHNRLIEEVVRQIHDGAIGEIVAAWAYRTQGPMGHVSGGLAKASCAYQIRNYGAFTWTNGSFFLIT